jgi:putative ABC transport system substrate-binding protein
MKRREFIAGLGSAVVMPLAARAQQRALPVIGFVSGESLEALPSHYLTALHAGLRELGYVDGHRRPQSRMTKTPNENKIPLHAL